MSGHSKWSTIKHKKAFSDAKKAKMFSKISRMISVAVKEKGHNPDTNFPLRLALEKARAINMPTDNIQRTIKKASTESTEKLESVQFEGYGPGGVALIIEAITDSRNRTSAEIRHLLSVHNGNMAIPGSVAWMFEKQGIIEVEGPASKRDEIEMCAIEAGAEDIITVSEDTMMIVTKPEDLHHIKNILTEKGFIVQNQEYQYTAKNKMSVDDAATQKAIENLWDALDDHEDVQEIYTNYDIIDITS